MTLHFSDFEIDAALQEAEHLLGLENSPKGHKGQGNLDQFHQHGQPGAEGPFPRPLSAFSLNEQVMQLRITAHEKDMELMELKAQLRDLGERSAQTQHRLEQLVESREATLTKLQDAVDLREHAIDNLANQLKAYQGVGPETVAALQHEHATLAADKAALEQAVGELRHKVQHQGARLQEGLQCWERVQAELQQENAGLLAALHQRSTDYQDVFQEKEVLRAKMSLLEGRVHNSLALVPANAAPAGLPAAHAAATEQVEQLRARLAVAAEKLENREATCRKYKEAVRALKRRNAELEQQLQQKETDGRSLAEQLHAARQEQQAHASEAAGGITHLEQQLREARQQCEGYSSRLEEVEAQLQRSEFQRAQWEWRVQDAEAKADAGSKAADASHAAALRVAERRTAQAEARAAELEPQAKAASLQVLQLEKQVQRLRQELDQLRQQHQAQLEAAAAATQQGSARAVAAGEVQRLQELLRSRQAAVGKLQQRISSMEAQHKQAEQSLKEQAQAKAVALADAEKRFRQLETVMRRVAAKKQQVLPGDDFLIGTALA